MYFFSDNIREVLFLPLSDSFGWAVPGSFFPSLSPSTFQTDACFSLFYRHLVGTVPSFLTLTQWPQILQQVASLQPDLLTQPLITINCNMCPGLDSLIFRALSLSVSLFSCLPWNKCVILFFWGCCFSLLPPFLFRSAHFGSGLHVSSIHHSDRKLYGCERCDLVRGLRVLWRGANSFALPVTLISWGGAFCGWQHDSE